MIKNFYPGANLEFAPINSKDFPKENDEFRLYVRHCLNRNYLNYKSCLPHNADTYSAEYRLGWETFLCLSGWSGLGWPTEYGGKALSLMHQAIYLEELAKTGAPLGINLIGHGIFAPTLLHYGSEEQKIKYLPGILNNSQIWCQGYSEPGSGSDLASIKTRADKTDQGYILNGHKIWTSFAHLADFCFVLARTDKDSVKHRGLSILLVDMKQDGVRVEPIRQITGDAEFCEVFFDSVHVSSDNVLGKENDGWSIAMTAASFERGTYFIPRMVQFTEELWRVRNLIEKVSSNLSASSLLAYQERWARLYADSVSLKLKSQRALQAAINGDPPGPEGSSTKVHWSESHQAMLELAMEILSINQVVANKDILQTDREFFTRAFLWSRAETILAGTSEIQRNIIGEKILGLAKG